MVLSTNVRSPRPRSSPSAFSPSSSPSTSRRLTLPLVKPGKSTQPLASDSMQSPIGDPLSVAETSAAIARVFPAQKAFRFEVYEHIVEHARMNLLFAHGNISTAVWNQIRAAVKNLAVPEEAKEAIKPPRIEVTKGKKKRVVAGPNNSAVIWPEGRASVMYTRTGVFRAMTKARVKAGKAKEEETFTPWLSSNTAVISCPALSPKYLDQILRVVGRVLRENQKDDKVAKEKQPKFDLTVAMLDGRLVGRAEVERIRKLPELDILRAQSVGVLEQAGRQMLGILSQAAGGSLVRTLQGLEKDLEAKQGGAPAAATEGEAPA